MSGPRPVTAYVWPHGLVPDAEGHDQDTDALATENPEDRDRGLFEAPSRYLARSSKRHAANPPGVPIRPASLLPPGGTDHDATGSALLPLPVARGPLTPEGATNG